MVDLSGDYELLTTMSVGRKPFEADIKVRVSLIESGLLDALVPV